jgi:hypothetical protein
MEITVKVNIKTDGKYCDTDCAYFYNMGTIWCGLFPDSSIRYTETEKEIKIIRSKQCLEATNDNSYE